MPRKLALRWRLALDIAMDNARDIPRKVLTTVEIHKLQEVIAVVFVRKGGGNAERSILFNGRIPPMWQLSGLFSLSDGLMLIILRSCNLEMDLAT